MPRRHNRTTIIKPDGRKLDLLSLYLRYSHGLPKPELQSITSLAGQCSIIDEGSAPLSPYRIFVHWLSLIPSLPSYGRRSALFFPLGVG